MTEIAELHARALDATGRIVDDVAADRWHAATSCADWDVRGLVNHLVAGNLWAAELARRCQSSRISVVMPGRIRAG